mgnify:CR=1 FL=1
MYKICKYVKILQEIVYLLLKTIRLRHNEEFKIYNCKYFHKRLKAFTRPKKLGKSENYSIFIRDPFQLHVT